MELIGYYVLFAVSISLTSCYFWFWPALQDAKKAEVDNTFTKYHILSTITYVILNSIVAPLLLLPMLSGAMATHFELGLRSEIMKADE
jgi:hypothetical protein